MIATILACFLYGATFVSLAIADTENRVFWIIVLCLGWIALIIISIFAELLK